MKRKSVVLASTLFWDSSRNQNVPTEKVFVIIERRFPGREVLLRFLDGPELDLSFCDMDRLVARYLQLRGVTLPFKTEDFGRCDPTLQRRWPTPHVNKGRTSQRGVPQKESRRKRIAKRSNK